MIDLTKKHQRKWRCYCEILRVGSARKIAAIKNKQIIDLLIGQNYSRG